MLVKSVRAKYLLMVGSVESVVLIILGMGDIRYGTKVLRLY